MIRVRMEYPADGASYLAVYDDREGENISPVPYGDYVESASKFNFIRNMLLNYEMMNEEERMASLADIEEALHNPSCCYSLEETMDRMAKSAEYSEIFQEISRTGGNQEVREIASDMKALEDSVEDAQIAYYMDNAEFNRLAEEAEEAIDAVSSLSDYEGSDIRVEKMLNREEADRVSRAQKSLNEITGKGVYKSLDDNIKEAALREIGRHPFKYSVFAAKESLKSIRNDVREGRVYVRNTEKTFTDTLKAAESYAVSAASDKMSLAAEAVKGASVYVANSLNDAYTKGSEMLDRAKEGVRNVSSYILRKADRIAEVLTFGGFSRLLEASLKKAFVSMDGPDATKGDRIVQKLVVLHASSHGYTLEEAADYLVSIKRDVWKKDGISPIDHLDAHIGESAYRAEKAAVDIKLAVIEKLTHAKERIMDVTDTVKDSAAYHMRETSLKVKEASLDLQITAMQNAVRFYERLDKVNDYRLGRLFNITQSMYEMRDRFDQNAERYREKADAVAAKPTEKSEVRQTIEILQNIENKGTAEKFAIAALEHKDARENLKKQIKNGMAMDYYNGNAAMSRVVSAELENEIAKKEEKIDHLYGRMDTICNKMESLKERINEKAMESMRVFDERTDLKSGRDIVSFSALKAEAADGNEPAEEEPDRDE